MTVAMVGLGLVLVERLIGWGSSMAAALLALVGLFAGIAVVLRNRRPQVDWRDLALAVEKSHPSLEGRLLTAIQQHPKTGAELGYLQERLVGETLARTSQTDWAAVIPRSRLVVAQAAHWLALVFLGLVVASLHVPGTHALLAKLNDSRVFISPGDTNIESGTSLIVLARFTGPVPAKVEMAIGDSSVDIHRIPLIKSLADPIFGGSLPEVASNLMYHVEYGGQRTRDFKVTVFEYPRLERADADLNFPEYTRQPAKRIEDTRRLTAVQGSKLDLTLQFNKPVAAARLVAKNQNPIPLQLETNRAIASLKQFPLENSTTYELQLADSEGRTNKVPAQFVFDVLSNRPPELRLASPRGDIRPSALEEISFEGTVWDDFGVEAYGLGYTIAGQDTKFVELGKQVPAKEKKQFQYLLRLEELGAQADQLVAWFAWADDIGPDGKLRRTASDMYFGEVRPFEEVFRESQGMEGEGQAGQENETDKLADLQKQIINATWRLQREHHGAPSSSTGPASGGLKQNQQPTARGTSAILRTDSDLQASSETRKATPFAASDLLKSMASDSRELPDPPAVIQMALATPRQIRTGWLVYSQVRPEVQGQIAGKGEPAEARSQASDISGASTGHASSGYPQDAGVVRDAQAQALEKANATARRQQDPRSVALWETATKEMERALARLNRSTDSPASLADALAAEQAAYQALMKLQAHEYQVSRSRNRNQNGSNRNQQMQRQLEQMDLTQPDDRYETQRQAQNQQTGERREQLQIMNRLQELARRQQDLNERLKELQTALQEARTEQERQEIQRRLKRLQEEEQQMLADVDELKQRMDRPENQSRMADERRQLEQTRNEVQRAAEAAAQGEASQALASGTRAQRQLQDLREQMRKENSSQFADDMREMRAEARELERNQEEIQKKMTSEKDTGPKSLSDSSEHENAIQQLAQQKQRMTNLVDRATQVSQQAEDSEPLLSRQLYDTVRKFSQDTAKNVKELQNELLNQRQMTRGIYDRLTDAAQPDGPKLLDVTSELLRQDSLPQAQAAGERTRTSITELKRGVERAAQSVIGDDTEALRLAQRELDQLTEQLQNEMAQAQGAENGTNRQQASSSAGTNNLAIASRTSQQNRQTQGQQPGQQAEQSLGGAPGQQNGEQAQAASQNQNAGRQPSRQASNAANQQAGQTGQQLSQADVPTEQPGEQGGQNGQQTAQARQQTEQAGQQTGQGGQQGDGQQQLQARGNPPDQNGQQTAQTGRGGRDAQNGTVRQAGNQPGELNPAANAAQANGGGGSPADWNRLLDANSALNSGPLTGDEFGPWSDRLRDVEEMVELPGLRNQVAVARDRARVVRQEFRKEHKKPDWAVVQSQIMKPLVEVRDQIADELARRQSNEALVPVDRDPVPTRYSDLVRRYYENLGKDK
jgi:hypothetical protein